VSSQQPKPARAKANLIAQHADPDADHKTDWTLKELAGYIQKNGVKIKWHNGGYDRILVEFWKQPPEVDPDSMFEATIGQDGFYSDTIYYSYRTTGGPFRPYQVTIRKCASLNAARDLAGSSPSREQWGVFVFEGDAADIKKLLDALPR
jgi:hypothetical protein